MLNAFAPHRSSEHVNCLAIVTIYLLDSSQAGSFADRSRGRRRHAGVSFWLAYPVPNEIVCN